MSKSYDPEAFYYLIHAACPSCGEVARLVEKRPEPVNLMQDVTITTDYCPYCGHHVGTDIENPEWDVHEDHEIEAVIPTQERPSPVASIGDSNE